MTRGPSHLRMAAVGVAAAALDLATKRWVFAAVPLHDERTVIPDFLLLRPQFNPFGPWSWGHGWEWLRWALPVVSVVAVAVIGRLWLQSDPGDRTKGLGLVLILGGALGNLWDRGRTLVDPEFKGVRDFIYLPHIVFGDAFPAFNLADGWITVGVILVGWRMIFEKERAAPPAPQDGVRP